MIVDLDRKGLESLVNGCNPYYSVFEHPLVKKCGQYSGGFNDRWNWKNFDDLSDEQLLELYKICTDSWK